MTPGQMPLNRMTVMNNRNEHKTALFHRAGNAGCAVAVDTRPKAVPGKKRRHENRKAAKAALRRGDW